MNNDERIHESDEAGPLDQVGLNIFAYARPTNIDGQIAFAIHGADGERIGMAPSLDIAHAVMLQHGLVPMALH